MTDDILRQQDCQPPHGKSQVYEFKIIHGITCGQCNGIEWWNVIVGGDVLASITTSENDAVMKLKELLP